MSWFQSLRDDFVLRPFETQHTSNDSVAMASEPPDVMTNQEPVEVTEECSKKKKSKFQTFKKLFARKKRKETSVSGAEAGLKASQSSDNVNNAPDNEALARSEKDNGSGSKLSLGSKALSHDSIFVSDSSEATEALGASQDSIHGKVKSLQLQLKQAIRLGSPPSLTCVKRLEDGGTTSEDDGLPCSPPEYSTLHTVLGQRNSSLSLEGTDSDDDQLSCATSSRAVSPLVAVPGDFSQPASPFGCLDNSASKHKLGLRHKACNKRRPATRVEIRPEEGPRRSTPEPAEQSDSSDQPMLTHKEDEGDRKEEEEDDEREIIEARDEEEGTPDPPKHSKHSPEPDTGEEEGKEDLDTREDISHPPGTPCSPLPSGITRYLPEEEREEKEEDSPAGPASGASSLDSTRVSPEPPAGPREYLLDPPGTAYGRTTENDAAESQALLITTPTMTMGERGEEDEDEEVKMEEEEEGSFLQEVLDSLRGSPLHSCGPGPESVFAGPEKLLAEEKEQEEVVSEEEQEQGADILEAEAAEQVEESAVEELEDVEAYRPSAPSAPVSQQKEEEPAPGGTATSCPAVGYVKEEDDGQNVEEEEEEDEVHVVEQPGVLEEKVVENKEAQGAGRESPTNEEEEEENATPSNEVERSEETEVGQEEDGQEQEFVDDDEGHEAESEGEEEAMALKNDVEVEGKEHGQEKQAEEENEVEREEEREREEKATVEETVYEETTAEEMEEEKEEESEASCDAVVLSSSAAEQEPTHTDMIPTVASGQVPEATPDGRAAYQPGTDDGVCGEGENQSAEAGGEEDEKVGDVEATEGAAADSIEDGRAVAEVDELTTNETHVDRKSQSDIDEMVMDQEPEPANSFQPSGLITAVSQSYAEIESQADGKDNAIDANADTPFDASPVLASSGQGESCLVEGSLPRSDSTVEDEEPTHLGPTEQNTDRQTCTGEVVKEELAGTVEEMGGGGGEVRGVSNKEEEEEEEEEPRQLSDIASVAVETEDKLPSVGAKRGRARFTVAPSWQRSPPVGGEEGGVRSSMETPVPVPVPRASSPPPRASASAVASEDRAAAVAKVSVATSELALSPVSPRSAGVLPARPPTTSSVTEESTVLVEENPENPFGVRLRRTAVLLPRRCSEEENAKSNPDPPAQPIVNKVAPSTPISVKPSLSQPISVKPTLPKKPEVQARMPEPSTGHGGSVGSSDSPRWVSMARQKQKIYKDGSLDAASAAKKGELERKSSLPTYVSSAACREPIKAPVSPCKVGSSETAKTVSPADKEVRSSLSPPAPVPPKPLSHPGPIAPKPYSQFTTATPKQPSQPTPFKGALPPPTLVPVVQRLSPCTSPPPLTKAPLPQPATLPSAKTPVPQSTALDVGRPTSQAGATAIPPPSSCRPSGSAPPVHLPRAQGPSGPQTLMPARGQPASGSPPPALPQDEPPWMALAKKKAKAWSEMPQIVQ